MAHEQAAFAAMFTRLSDAEHMPELLTSAQDRHVVDCGSRVVKGQYDQRRHQTVVWKSANGRPGRRRVMDHYDRQIAIAALRHHVAHVHLVDGDVSAWTTFAQLTLRLFNSHLASL